MTDLKELVWQVKASFRALKARCPHRDGSDCGHPKIDFDHMACAECNCPLLLENEDD